MKKVNFSIIGVSILLLVSSCKQGNNAAENKPAESQDPAEEVWAEQIQSISEMVQPADYDDAYWKSLNKKVDNNKIFNTITAAVLGGKLKAYNIVTDSIFTIDAVKALLSKTDPADNKVNSINLDDFSKIRMREKWVFDKEKLKLEKQVTRIDFLFKKVDPNGEFIGDRPLFYVNLN